MNQLPGQARNWVPPSRRQVDPKGEPDPNTLGMVGRLHYLLASSTLYKGMSLQQFDNRIVRPYAKNQFRYYERGNQPLGIITWAWLTDDMQSQLIAYYRHDAPFPLDVNDWNRGPHLWFIDCVVPFGGLHSMIGDLRNTIFAGKKGYYFRGGDVRSIRGAST